MPLATLVGAKGVGLAVRAISTLKNKATDILKAKKTKAELKVEQAKSRAAQLSALAGGTAYSQEKELSQGALETFGIKPNKAGVREILEPKKQKMNMEKAKEFFMKNWVYLAVGVVALMFLKKRR